ncbi:putative copper-importing P-type ATPase A [Paraliobacillus sp. PM-2]|uniref:HAD family hydrolase n=1 Tax=Paraliobacillus sp. PM-2 TaxID=1462524 RepID=UPI00061CB145|nr:HAD family hydrolase [Paraliobacillus sp. PM-2]CQR48407.1 putative copper-importing P-type ATPase A [Paraliobacillus sp. PM-2]
MSMDFHFSQEVKDQLQSIESSGQTAILVANKEHLLSILAIADKARQGVKQMIEQIKQTNAKEVIMLTGDNERTASAIANELNLSQFMHNYYLKIRRK